MRGDHVTPARVDVDLILRPNAATVMFGRRLHFQALLRLLRDDGKGYVVDLSDVDAEATAPGTVVVLRHARELRLGDVAGDAVRRPGP